MKKTTKQTAIIALLSALSFSALAIGSGKMIAVTTAHSSFSLFNDSTTYGDAATKVKESLFTKFDSIVTTHFAAMDTRDTSALGIKNKRIEKMSPQDKAIYVSAFSA